MCIHNSMYVYEEHKTRLSKCACITPIVLHTHGDFEECEKSAKLKRENVPNYREKFNYRYLVK